MRTWVLFFLAVGLSLSACSGAAEYSGAPAVATEAATESGGMVPGMGMGMGRQSGMMERHHAQIPAEFAGVQNPVAADAESIQRGAEIYALNCASCHGDGGMGDGPAGAALDPAPAAVAHTSQMMADDYLFWRISAGGAGFVTSMPAWQDILDEQGRWDVINYLRALGSGQAKPASQMGGALYDPAAQAQHQAEMLAQAVAQGVVTQEEADIFESVHDALEVYRAAHPEIRSQGASADEREALMLAELLKNGGISQSQADAFKGIHDRLGAADLMP